MPALAWPADLKAPVAYAPGVINSDVQSNPIGPVEDVTHRWTKRTLSLEWGNMSNQDFARLDALVDYLQQRRGVARVPWWPYQAMIGGGDGQISLSGKHNAGVTTIATTGWTGANPVVDFGDFVQISDAVPRLHRVLAPANATGGAATITVEPGLWRDHSAGERVRHLRDPDPVNPFPFLALAMRLSDPNEVQGQVFASPRPQYGRGIVYAFTEAITIIELPLEYGGELISYASELVEF